MPCLESAGFTIKRQKVNNSVSISECVCVRLSLCVFVELNNSNEHTIHAILGKCIYGFEFGHDSNMKCGEQHFIFFPFNSYFFYNSKKNSIRLAHSFAYNWTFVNTMIVSAVAERMRKLTDAENIVRRNMRHQKKQSRYCSF